MAASLRAASSSLANRTVHVKTFPSARTLAESREVLRVLEKFGEVTMFRSLKHHPVSPVQNAFISIFSSATAAQEIINASPVRYRLVVEPNPQIPSNGTEPPAQKPNEKVFSLSLNISHYTHDQYISHPTTNPLYGPFKPIDIKRSGIAAHLNKNLKPSMWSEGLSDWESDNGRRSAWGEEEEGEEGKEGEREGVKKHLPRNDAASAAVPWRLVEKDLEVRVKGRPAVMEGLAKLVGDGKG